MATVTIPMPTRTVITSNNTHPCDVSPLAKMIPTPLEEESSDNEDYLDEEDEQLCNAVRTMDGNLAEAESLMEPAISAARALLTIEGREKSLRKGVFVPTRNTQSFMFSANGFEVTKSSSPSLMHKWKRKGSGNGKVMRVRYNPKRNIGMGKQQLLVPQVDVVWDGIPRVFGVKVVKKKLFAAQAATPKHFGLSDTTESEKKGEGAKISNIFQTPVRNGPSVRKEPGTCGSYRAPMTPKTLFDAPFLSSPPTTNRQMLTPSGAPWGGDTPQRVFTSFCRDDMAAQDKMHFTPLPPTPSGHEMTMSPSSKLLLRSTSSFGEASKNSNKSSTEAEATKVTPSALSPLSDDGLPKLPPSFAGRTENRAKEQPTIVSLTIAKTIKS